MHTARGAAVQFDGSCASVLEALPVGGVVAKVADFGLSKHMHRNQSHASGVRQGTPFFIAPEVVQKHHLHPLSDVFAFGVMMWELMKGCPVFVKCALACAPCARMHAHPHPAGAPLCDCAPDCRYSMHAPAACMHQQHA